MSEDIPPFDIPVICPDKHKDTFESDSELAHKALGMTLYSYETMMLDPRRTELPVFKIDIKFCRHPDHQASGKLPRI